MSRSLGRPVLRLLTATLVVLLLTLSAPSQADTPELEPNPAPTAVADEASVGQDDQVLVQVLWNDQLYGTVSITGTSGVMHGQAVVEGSAVMFTPARAFAGEAGFDYTVTNETGSSQAHVTVTVTPGANCPYVGDALGAAPGMIASQGWVECADPTAHDAETDLVVGLPGDGGAALLTTGTAANAAPDAVKPPSGTSWSSGNTHGLASDVSTYRLRVAVPEGDNCLAFDYVVGSDEFGDPADARDGFVASIGSDDWSLSSSGPGAEPELSAPHAFATYTTRTAAVLGGQSNGTSYAGLTAPQHAEVGVPQGRSTIFLSVYDGGYPGHPSDPAGDTGVFLDNLTTFSDPEGCASPDNHLPQADDDGSPGAPLPVTTGVATPLVVSDNDYDEDGDALAATVFTSPQHGTATCESGTDPQNRVICWYSSNPGYAGPDTFGYRVSDGKGGFDTATVHVNATAEDPRVVEIVGAQGQPDVTISAQVRWPNYVGDPHTSARLLVGPDEAGEDGLVPVGANTSSDEFGFVTFAPHHISATGRYLFRVRLVAAPQVHGDLSRLVDLDPPTNVVLAGPTTVQVGVESTWTISMTRASGAAVQAFEGSCLVEGEDAPPFPVPCTTDDGLAEFPATFQHAGDVNLRFEGSDLSAMCFVHVQDDQVASTGDCSDAPPSPLETLALTRTNSNPVTVGDAVRFTVSATRADDSPFEGTLLCGLAPGTAVDCGGPSPGLFNTDATGHAVLCWVPESEGEVTFGVADRLDLADPGTTQQSVVLQVGPSDGHDVPCTGGPDPVSSLTLSGVSAGDVGEPAVFTVTANAASEGPLACSVKRNGVTQAVSACTGITNGAGALQFTPGSPGDYLVTVSSGGVTSAPRTFHAVQPISALALAGPSAGEPGSPVTWTVTANAGSEGPLACSVKRNDVAQVVSACTGITNGAGAVQFTPGSPGDYVVTVSSGGVTSAPRTFHATELVLPTVSSVTIAGSATRVTWPASLTISGTLSAQGIAPSAVPVELWAGPDPTALSRIGAYTPTASGALAVTPPAPTRATYYQWRVPGYPTVSATVRVEVAAVVTVRATKLTGRLKGKDRVTGAIAPSRRGAPVLLQRKLAQGGWKTVARATSSGSSYTFTLRAARGPRQYRVVVAPDTGRLGVTSRIARLR